MDKLHGQLVRLNEVHISPISYAAEHLVAVLDTDKTGFKSRLGNRCKVDLIKF